MKFFSLNIFFILFIQSIYAFSQSNLPKGSLIVAKDGSGGYKTVQAAVNALSSSASSERVIFIKSGTYKEQVSIQKNFVTLIGENKDKVIITNNLNNAKTGSSAECATVKVKCDNFKAFDITFENTAPFPGNNAQAPAFYSYGKKHYIENCNFLSYQDTLLSYHGTQYFKNCYIRGVTDFIWGFGRAVFENCQLHVVNKNKNTGYLTANGNEDGNFKEGGFLITNSKVKVDSGVKYYLGRLWKKNCYVIFNNTELPGSSLAKEGWLTFSGNDNYKNTSKVGEYKCYGSNYSTSGRVSYATKFNSAPSVSSFLGGDLSFTKSVYSSSGSNNNNNNTNNNVKTTIKKTTVKTTIKKTTTVKVKTTTTKISKPTPTQNTNTNNNSNNNNWNWNNFDWNNWWNNWGSNNQAANPKPTTTKAKKTTTTKKAASTNNSNSNCRPLFFQCGGSNYKGSKCCQQGTCKKYNEWYSQCV